MSTASAVSAAEPGGRARAGAVRATRRRPRVPRRNSRSTPRRPRGRPLTAGFGRTPSPAGAHVTPPSVLSSTLRLGAGIDHAPAPSATERTSRSAAPASPPSSGTSRAVVRGAPHAAVGRRDERGGVDGDVARRDGEDPRPGVPSVVATRRRRGGIGRRGRRVRRERTTPPPGPAPVHVSAAADGMTATSAKAKHGRRKRTTETMTPPRSYQRRVAPRPPGPSGSVCRRWGPGSSTIAALRGGAAARGSGRGGRRAGCPTTPVWVEFSDGSVTFRDDVFRRPGIVVGSAGARVPQVLREGGATTMYWEMNLDVLVGTPSEPGGSGDHRWAPPRRCTTARSPPPAAATRRGSPSTSCRARACPARGAPRTRRTARTSSSSMAHLTALGAHPFLLVPSAPARRRRGG